MSSIRYLAEFVQAAAGGGPTPLTANPGALTFSGSIANLLASRKLVSNPGTLTFTGSTAGTLYKRVLVASPGTLGFTGSVASFLLGKILSASPGTLTLTGSTATLRAARKVTANPGSLSFTGSVASFLLGKILSASPGTLTLSGATASTLLFRVLPATPGTLTLTGSNATLTAPVASQIARPIADIAGSAWLPSSGTDLFAMVDEAVASDVDYDYSPTNPTTEPIELLFDTVTDPGVHTGHILRFRLAAVGLDTVFDVYLMCGATQIATWTKTVVAGDTTTYAETLDPGDAANITDYADLRIKVIAHG